MAGPMKHGAGGKGQKPQNTGKTIKRLLSYMGQYKGYLVLVLFCILISAGATIMGSYLLQPIINDYITPFIGQQHPNLAKFIGILSFMLVVYVLGAVMSYLNSRIMLKIATSILYKIRTQLFDHMETLPLQYFDTNTHGDLMSRFTNDTDTLRDMLSQALPQMLTSVITVIASFVMMLVLSPILTVIVIVVIFLMVFITGLIGKHSGAAFKDQQKNIGRVNGYIEEMIEGQKVVKVFCREEETKKEFISINEDLCKAGTKANTLANLFGPIMTNLGHVNTALIAIVGVLLVIAGKLSLGAIASFLQYSKNFTQPITQMAQIFNNLLNALAGAERIFNVIDTPSEVDDGDVTLVNVNILADGTITESFLQTY